MQVVTMEMNIKNAKTDSAELTSARAGANTDDASCHHSAEVKPKVGEVANSSLESSEDDVTSVASLATGMSNGEDVKLSDAETQAKYRAAYMAQLRLRSCPGCGESEFLG
jgi:hypothetical protein